MADTNLNIKVRLQNLVTKELNKIKTGFGGLKRVKQDWVALTAKVYLFANAVRMASRAMSGFIKASDKVEQLQVRLKVLMGSAEAGNQVFADMADLAGKVPKTYDEIMESATALGGVVKDGTKEIKELMPMIVDLSSATGMSVRDVTGQMIRMYSAGIASADMFRERGVSAMMGFSAGAKYTARETMDQFKRAFNDVNSKFRGASNELAETWSGKMSMMSDAWFNFSKEIGKFFTENEGVNWWLDEFKFAMEYWAKYIQKNLNTQASAMDLLRGRLKKLDAEIATMRKRAEQAIFGQAPLLEKLAELEKKRLETVSAINMEQEDMAVNLEKISVVAKKGGKEIKQSFLDMEEVGKGTANAMKDAFSDIFFDAMKFEFSNLKNIMSDFGNAMMRMFADLLAKKAVVSIFSGMGLGSAGFATGTNYVPQTGAYMLHKGETVTPAGNARGGSGSGVTINITQAITAWDASDVYRNRKVLSDAVAYEIQNNGNIRSAIQQYA